MFVHCCLAKMKQMKIAQEYTYVTPRLLNIVSLFPQFLNFNSDMHMQIVGTVIHPCKDEE